MQVVEEVPVGVKWDGKTGRIDGELVRHAVPDLSAATFFVCGPPAMVNSMAAILSSLGVPDSSVRIEHFEGYA